jgi:hypothetical protein
MNKWVLPMLLLFAMGCWSSDGDRPAANRPDAASRDETTTLAMWEWPAAAGQPRDLAADHAECMRKADAQTTAMKRAGVLWDCMRGKGWHRIKERNRMGGWEALKAPWIWGGEPSKKPDLPTDEHACNEPAVVRDASQAELERYFACMADKGWRRNDMVWKERLSQ